MLHLRSPTSTAVRCPDRRLKLVVSLLFTDMSVEKITDVFYKVCIHIVLELIQHSARKPMTVLLWHVWKQLHPWLSKRIHLSWRYILFVTPCYHAGLPQVDVLWTLNMMPEWSSWLCQQSAVISLLWIECSSVDQTIAQVLNIIITVIYIFITVQQPTTCLMLPHWTPQTWSNSTHSPGICIPACNRSGSWSHIHSTGDKNQEISGWILIFNLGLDVSF